MNRTSFFVIALAATLGALSPARAAPPTKVWVSHGGADSATCGPTASPCATFRQAYTNVAAGGEIGVLDPGSYGSVDIRKSVNITNDGAGEASILGAANTFYGIYVSAGVGDLVSLRGLVPDGQGVGDVGIDIVQAVAVHVQNCVIRNFEDFAGGVGGFGIFVNEVGSGHIQLLVSDSIIYNNGSGARTGGIVLWPNAGTINVDVVLDRVHLENNVAGLRVDGTFGGGASSGPGVHVVIRDSVVSANAGDGIIAYTTPGNTPAFIFAERTSSVNNAGTGVVANGPHATILLKDNTVARNGVGMNAVNTGQLISYGNNAVNNNIGADGMPTSSISLR